MYTARITRQHQALFILLVDQSGSMDEKATIGSRTLTKAEYVAEVANTMISELKERCSREEGIRDYFRIGAIGYRDNEIHPLLSDGEATDADHGQLVELAQRIKELSTGDGPTLILNIHIADQSGQPRALFPTSIAEVPVDRNARALYEMSSELPASYDPQVLAVRGDQARGPFRGLCYNTPVTDLVAMMNIGSVSVELMQ